MVSRPGTPVRGAMTSNAGKYRDQVAPTARWTSFASPPDPDQRARWEPEGFTPASRNSVSHSLSVTVIAALSHPSGPSVVLKRPRDPPMLMTWKRG